MAGLDSTGFTPKTAAEVLADIETAQRGALGADLDVSPEQPIGQLNAIVAAKLAEVWELAAALYAGRRPSSAVGASLDALCELTGITRRGATYGTVTLSVTLNAGVTLAAGAVASVAGQPANRWITTAAAVNSSGGTATVGVAARAETAGVVRATAGTITVIATPTSGWTGVTNAGDAAPGAAAETDAVLRARREQQVRAGGSSPVDALRAAVRAVNGVTDVAVFENTSPLVVDGMAPHSIEVVAVGGDDQAIGGAVWKAKAAGIETVGSTSVTVLDAGGIERVVRFSRPTPVPLWVIAVVQWDRSAFTSESAMRTAVISAVVARGDLLRIGELLRIEAVRAVVFGVPGIVDVADFAIGTTSFASNTRNWPAARRELIDLDSLRVRVESA